MTCAGEGDAVANGRLGGDAEIAEETGVYALHTVRVTPFITDFQIL